LKHGDSVRGVALLWNHRAVGAGQAEEGDARAETRLGKRRHDGYEISGTDGEIAVRIGIRAVRVRLEQRLHDGCRVGEVDSTIAVGITHDREERAREDNLAGHPEEETSEPSLPRADFCTRQGQSRDTMPTLPTGVNQETLAAPVTGGVEAHDEERRLMARKAGMSGPQSTTEVLARLQANMKDLQREAEAALSRTRKQASQLISKDQKRALDRLLAQAQSLRSDLEKRARRASRDVESQADRLVSTLEKEATKRLRPLLERLELPSRAEVRTLAKRIAELEKKLKTEPAVGDKGSDNEPQP